MQLTNLKPQLPDKIFVTGIGTDVGKTVVSAILTQALQADYWKPIQAGGLSFTDTDFVRLMVNNPVSRFHHEAYRFNTAASPHYAAQQDGVEIALSELVLPLTDNRLIVEGAGGLMVPLNNKQTVIDFVQDAGLPVILVANNYLGSINHTLLSIAALKQYNIPLLGIIFNGEKYLDNAEIIQQLTDVNILGTVAQADTVDSYFIEREAEQMQLTMQMYFDI